MSKNMFKWTLGLLAVGCMLAIAAPAGAETMDSASFTWKYEMDVEPSAADLDGPGTEYDFTKYPGGSSTASADPVTEILTINSAGGGGSDKLNYRSFDTGQPWVIDTDISFANGYTIEMRLKVADVNQYDRGFLLLSSADAGDARLYIQETGQTWSTDGGATMTPIGNTTDDNSDWVVFRLAQNEGVATYSVWRDGVLLGDSLGPNSGTSNRLIVGDTGQYDGFNAQVDYLRFTGGDYAPIPEPGTLVLLAGGLMLLLLRRRW